MDTGNTTFNAVAERAIKFIPNEGTIGLGSGRAAAAFIHALSKRVIAGLRIQCVPTSKASATLAAQLGIPLVTLDEVNALDVAVDGADEVDPQGNLIKGLGGALVREKIVAASARRLIIVVGVEKLVPVLGTHGILPVEVIPFGLSLCSRRMIGLGLACRLRLSNGKTFVSDNGNYILDVQVQAMDKPNELEQTIRAIPGVVGTGLFLGMSPTVLIQRGESVEVREPRTTG
ncbi:MAG TPA: ribose-5-phosphate isomerase RpiA [Gemmata sp.]|jgi:ribose 5-phosphate isomerase A|nr:ribose-5-phosphate isomerase RpiA [Gemmata sp.]